MADRDEDPGDLVKGWTMTQALAPTLVDLPAELQSIRDRWVDLPRREQDVLYAEEFAEPFAGLFADLPLHNSLAGMEPPRALLSVLGFSWQPVALMAAWAKPETMLVLGTPQSLELTVGGEGVIALVARIADLPMTSIRPAMVSDSDEAAIYRIVRDFIRTCGVPARQVFVDPTGGKKSMSVSTSLAAFLEGSPLIYVDYGRYHAERRIPVAGTEYPRLLENPLHVLGDLELRDVFRAFDRSDFREAAHLAGRLAQRLYEPREAQTLEALSAGYGKWDAFDFSGAQGDLSQAQMLMKAHATYGSWDWSGGVSETLSKNLTALEQLVSAQTAEHPVTMGKGVPLLMWYLSSARRFLEAGKTSLAILLTYAAVERYVYLCLWVEFGLSDDAPDYSLVEERLDREKYAMMGKLLFGKKYRPADPEGKLMLGNGVQLLATLNEERMSPSDFGSIMGMMATRNKCEYEHGFIPKVPQYSDVEQYLKKAEEIISRVCGGLANLDEELGSYCFAKLHY